MLDPSLEGLKAREDRNLFSVLRRAWCIEFFCEAIGPAEGELGRHAAEVAHNNEPVNRGCRFRGEASFLSDSPM